MRKMLLVGPKAGATIAEFSKQFQSEWVSLLRTRHSTNRVRANAVYNEYIQDKHHVHMNSTRWVTLSGFVMTLGKAGIVKVDEDEKGLWVTWVDNSPTTLAKQVGKNSTSLSLSLSPSGFLLLSDTLHRQFSAFLFSLSLSLSLSIFRQSLYPKNWFDNLMTTADLHALGVIAKTGSCRDGWRRARTSSTGCTNRSS